MTTRSNKSHVRGGERREDRGKGMDEKNIKGKGVLSCTMSEAPESCKAEVSWLGLERIHVDQWL